MIDVLDPLFVFDDLHGFCYFDAVSIDSLDAFDVWNGRKQRIHWIHRALIAVLLHFDVLKKLMIEKKGKDNDNI